MRFFFILDLTHGVGPMCVERLPKARKRRALDGELLLYILTQSKGRHFAGSEGGRYAPLCPVCTCGPERKVPYAIMYYLAIKCNEI